MKSKWKKLPVVLIGIIAIAVCGCSNDLQELNQKRSSAAKENTESTETVRTGTWAVPGKQLHRLLMVLILNL